MTAKFYGLIGAHRVGKTTLAKGVADDLGIPFYVTSVGKFLASISIDPQADMPFKDRINVQDMILNSLMVDYAKAYAEHRDAPLVIVDRTPLDVLAYTTSEILRTTMTPELDELMAAHEKRCYEAMNFHFVGSTLVQPGIPIVPDATKGAPNVHYQRHVNATMIEAALNHRLKVPTIILASNNLEFQSRVNDVAEHCDAIIDKLSTRKESLGIPGSYAIH